MLEKNTLDEFQNENFNKEVSFKTIKVLSVFSILGSSLFILLLIIFQFTVDRYFVGIDDSVRLFLRIWMGVIAIFPISTLIGAVLMRKRKKLGFYIYMVSNIIYLALMIYGFTGQLGNGSPDFITLTAIFILPLLFTILFSLHIKKLK